MARKVLLADDSVTAQNMGRRILTDAGYEVVTVNNGSAALKKIAEQKPDIIVLDVYMPGYGGLEVCQRLKETRDTARIPVLLTVGKLEPFKAEEARRARADAYIVKPFEASELLTALTKLEDKIVPGPEPYKSGRFAKAIAAFEEPQSGESFGDQETGWKERLIIPSPNKAEEPEAERTPIPVGLHRSTREEDFKPEEPKGFERPLPAGLPADITPEEISAISAAAAALNGTKPEAGSESSDNRSDFVAERTAPVESAQVQLPVPEIQAEASESPTVAAKEAAPATFASAPTVETSGERTAAQEYSEPIPAAAEEEAAPESDQTEIASPDSEEGSAEPAEAKPLTAVEPIPQEADPIEKPPEKHTDAEVLAALAMLGTAEDTDAVSAFAVNGNLPHGPRWIVDPVALEMAETGITLEREMEEMFAVTAAFEAGRAMAAALPAHHDGAGSIDHSRSTSESQLNSEVVAPSTSHEVDISNATEVRAVAENPSDTVADPLVAAVAEEKAAFAAAASGGIGGGQTTVPSLEIPATAGFAVSAQTGPEADSFEPGPHPTQSSEPGANVEEVKDTAKMEASSESKIEDEAAKPQPSVESDLKPSESAAADDPSAISSLVDNMLAELKPKLMEELTKKLAKAKKKN